MKELQIENGNYTRITNPLIEELIKIPFKGCELAVALFIIRKTYGFQKKQDEISLTQFEKGLNRSRPAIVKALKNLQLVNVAKLVKVGDSRNSSNLWEINKYYDTWQLVKVAKLVKYKQLTSKGYDKKLVKVPLHTKETIQKKYTKEIDIPPKIEEVKEYCLERKNDVNPDKWFDFYSAKGWLIGRNKMKDWKAAVRTWESGSKKVDMSVLR